MKKLLLILAIVATSLAARSQAFGTKQDVKDYINLKIVPNSSRAITPDVMKKILLGLWDFDADSIWLSGTNFKYRRGSLVFTIPFTTSSGLSDTSFLHKGLTESVWGTKTFLQYTYGLAPALSDSSTIFPTTGWIKRYLAAHPFTELDPVWTAASINYYTKTQSDTRFVPLTRNITINGVTHDLSVDRSWTVSLSETDPKRVTNIQFIGNDSVHTLVLTKADASTISTSFFDRGSGGGAGGTDTAFILQQISDSLAAHPETDPLSVHVSDSAAMLNDYINDVGFGMIKTGKVVSFDSSFGFHSEGYNDGRYLQSFTELDPVWIGDSSAVYKKVHANDLFAIKLRNINTGYGMLGGGNLSADRTLIVDTSLVGSKTYIASYLTANRNRFGLEDVKDTVNDRFFNYQGKSLVFRSFNSYLYPGADVIQAYAPDFMSSLVNRYINSTDLRQATFKINGDYIESKVSSNPNVGASYLKLYMDSALFLRIDQDTITQGYARNIATFQRRFASSTKTPVNGIGIALDFRLSTDSIFNGEFVMSPSNRFISKWGTVAHLTRTSEVDITGINSMNVETFMNIQHNLVRINNNNDTLAKLSDVRSSATGGTVTVFSKTDGYGIVSSVANSTTTPNHTIRVDTSVIATLYQNSLKQNQLNGTGFVKASGTTISYDNSTYLSTIDINNGDTLIGGKIGLGGDLIRNTTINMNDKIISFSGNLSENGPNAGIFSVTNSNSTFSNAIVGIASGSAGVGVSGYSNFYGVQGTGVNGAGVRGSSTGGIGGLFISANSTPLYLQTFPVDSSGIRTMTTIYRATLGTPLAGIGSSIDFGTQTVGSGIAANRLISRLTDPASATQTSEFDVIGAYLGSAETFMKIQHGQVIVNNGSDSVATKAYARSLVGGSGETNTASNLGGGLANYSTKVGVDLQFNSFDGTDFDLGSNLFTIDATLKSTWNGKQSALSGTGLVSFSGTTASYNTTSASISSIISDETGNGNMVFSSGPTLVNPIVGTQSQNDNSTKASSTAYVDLAVANAVAAVNPAVAVEAATTANVSGYTYNNGVGGIGATLTQNSAAVVVIDGYTLLLNDRVLFKNQTTGEHNGVYFVSTLGTGVIPAVFTRALDYNQPSDINNTGAIPVINGTVNATTSWLLTSSVTTVGTDPLTYTQFTYAPASLFLVSNNLSEGVPATMRTNLGLVIGTNVQAYNANLTTYAGITPSANVQTLLGAANYSAFRTSLSLVPGTDVEVHDADLTAIGAIAGTAGYLKKTAANTWSLDNSTFLTDNQTITLSGDVSGSGSTAITTTIGSGVVTNTMLAGSIAYSKLSLTGAILNADLAGSIAYSKLSLTGALLNADLAGSVDAAKINTGVVSNAEFNYLDGVTSGIQAQMDLKQALGTYAPTGAAGNYDVASTSYVTAGTQTLTLAAGDRISFKYKGVIVNNSGAGKTYTFSINVGGFAVEMSDGATVAANATNEAILEIEGVIYIVSTSSAKGIIHTMRSVAIADGATGDANTNTTNRQGKNSTASNLTGSQACTVAVKSSAANTTQTLTTYIFEIKKQ